MGVKECHRRDCDTTMCDTYIPDIGYICGECQSEFEYLMECRGLSHATEYEIATELKKFMETSKSPYDKETKMSVQEFFDKN